MGYGRSGNESWTALEDAISALEGGGDSIDGKPPIDAHTLAFSSGMAAISALLATLPHKAPVIAGAVGYQGTTTLLKEKHDAGDLDVTFVDLVDTDAVIHQLEALSGGLQLLYLESPINPTMEVIDLPALIHAANEVNERKSAANQSERVIIAVDNTLATPFNQQPLAMGAHVCIHSVTKYLSGHSDLILGSVTVNAADPDNERLLKKIERARVYGGAIAGPFEAWLALRGMRTLAIRMQTAQANALELATRLSQDPRVHRVRYPGLVPTASPVPTSSASLSHLRAKSFMTGYGAMLAFEVCPDIASVAQVDAMCDASSVIVNSTSLGGVESLWERRRRWPTESPETPEHLIRFSVGIENVEDLWVDIQSAFAAANILSK